MKNNISLTVDEIYIVESLNLNFKTILELGCGEAKITQKIASNGHTRRVIACEVDEVQHKKNLKLNIKDKNIKFLLCKAQELPLEDNSIDFVFMFKSFHHIPKVYMKKALEEIKRVLKPKGMAYISEPLHQGLQNELVSIFHNEEEERIAAFETIKEFVNSGELSLFKEFFFQTPITYKNFGDFEKKQMNHTFHNKKIDDKTKQLVEKKYKELGGDELTLLKPFRVDILKKR